MKDKALALHKNGKITVESKVEIKNHKDLSLAYTPGVAHPCLEIVSNIENVYQYTSKGHMVAVVSDGTAVLGLGDIGPYAALPVIEGKVILLKQFAGIDAFPICLDTKDPKKIIETVKMIAPSFGGIILEDISAPRCVEIERQLKNELSIPVFHDDQHGTAIVVGAALINASRYIKKPITEMRAVICGTGAAGSAVMRIIKNLGIKEINAYNISGVIDNKKYNDYDFVIQELLDEGIILTPNNHNNTLASIIEGSDVFIGVSAGNLVSEDMVKSMANDPIIFALANPHPEIMPDLALKAGAKVVGSGRSDFPNQINNVLAFPGIFKGALAAKAKNITEEMKLTSAYAIAHLLKDDELRSDYIIPSVFDLRVVDAISNAIIEELAKN